MENLNDFEIKTWYTDGCIRIWNTKATGRYDALNQFMSDMVIKKELVHMNKLTQLQVSQKSFK